MEQDYSQLLIDLYEADNLKSLDELLVYFFATNVKIPTKELMHIIEVNDDEVLTQKIISVLASHVKNISPELIEIFNTTESLLIKKICITLLSLNLNRHNMMFLVDIYFTNADYRDDVFRALVENGEVALIAMATYIEPLEIDQSMETLVKAFLKEINADFYYNNKDVLGDMKIADIFYSK